VYLKNNIRSVDIITYLCNSAIVFACRSGNLWNFRHTRTAIFAIINRDLISTGFVVFSIVFLTNPTIEELEALDMPLLLDMLTYQTSLHVQLLQEEGLSITSKTCRECIINIQTAIEVKRSWKRSNSDTRPAVSSTQDTPV